MFGFVFKQKHWPWSEKYADIEENILGYFREYLIPTAILRQQGKAFIHAIGFRGIPRFKVSSQFLQESLP